VKEVEEKLTREMEYKYLDLLKNDFIITPKGIGKITQPMNENFDDIAKTKFKVDFDGKTENINLENLNFSVYKSINVYVVNYLNRIFKLNFTIDINQDFESFKEHFCDLYNLDLKTVALVYKNNKLNKKDLKKKFGKDFDYENDFVTVLQGETKPHIQKIDGYEYAVSLSEVETHKFIFTVNVPIICLSFFLFKATYSGCKCRYNDFELSIVTESIENFKNEDVKEVKTTSEKKKKKKGGEASKNSDSIYSFEKLFKYPDKYNYETLKTVDAITADREDSDDSDNDNESDSQSSSMSEKRKNIEKKCSEVNMDGIILQPETIYQVKFKLNTFHGDVQTINFKSDKVKKFLMRDNFEITFHLPGNEKNPNRNILHFAGLEFTIQTIFEKFEKEEV